MNLRDILVNSIKRLQFVIFFLLFHIIRRKDNDMRENFEIEKELKFNNNLAEILSISLEEKHEIVDKKLVGSFLISGEYKIHEISLNKEKFNFKIPFEYEIKSDIEESSISLNITDFIYDVKDGSLFVTISYELNGDRKDILLFDDEEDLDEFLKSREVELVIDDVINDIDDSLTKSDEVINENLIKEEIVDEAERVDEEIKYKNDEVILTEKNEDRDIDVAKQNLLNSVKVDDDDYITYQIHIVKENDTLESILVKYNMSLDELKEYNDFNSLSLGMKLIIPIVNEK